MSKRKSFSDKVFVSLKNKIARLDQLKVVNHLVNDTECDFTRNRKLPFPDVVMIVLSLAGCPIREELLDYFDYDINTATASAFVQARAKVLPDAFEQLLLASDRKGPPFGRFHLALTMSQLNCLGL